MRQTKIIEMNQMEGSVVDIWVENKIIQMD